MRTGHALTRLVTATRSAHVVALCRISVGLGALVRGLKTTRDLYLLQHDPNVIPVRVHDWAPQITQVWQIALVGVVWVIASVGLAIGYRARACAVLLLVLAVGQQMLDDSLQAYHMDFLVAVLFFTALMDADAALSVRAWRGRGAYRVPAWPVWLLQVQLSVAYFFTAVAKLNVPFLSGQVLLARLALPEFMRDPAMIRLVAAGTVGLELFLAFGLWNRRTRPYAFAGGFLLHGLVPLTMGLYAGLVAFSFIVLAVYLLFLDDDVVDRRCAGIARRWRWQREDAQRQPRRAPSMMTCYDDVHADHH